MDDFDPVEHELDLIFDGQQWQVKAARRLELLRDLVDAFEANCFLADQIPEETTAYILAKKELADGD